MGIRSQVGIALKTNIADEIISKHPWILEICDEQFESKEGKLFVFNSIKWYVEQDLSIARLYSDFNNYDDSDFLVIEACSHTECIGDESCRGSWNDNPWGLSKVVDVYLNYADFEGTDDK